MYIFIWWFFLFVLGTISFPLASLLFGKFFDSGWGLIKTIGVVCLSYVFLVLSSVKILPFESWALATVVVLYTLINLTILLKNSGEILDLVRKHHRIIIFQEGFFVVGLLAWTFVRGHSPDINGLEKFMDYGFINSILRGKYLPPSDMWYAGSPVNYYWFGHLYTSILTKVSQVPQSVSYNLMIATIFGLTLTGIFSIVSTITLMSFSKNSAKTAFIAGILSAFLVALAGNFHTPYFALKDGVDKYWYPDATRFIGYNPETNDKTIHEFPIYSFVVSDLHGHLLNLPFVVLFIAVLFSFLNQASFNHWTEEIKKLVGSAYFFIPFLLGVMFMTSTWDFGNYLILTGIGLVVFNLRNLRKDILKSSTGVVGISLSVFVLGMVFALPFLLHFKSIAQGIDLVKSHTPVWQLAVLWGFPAVLTIIFLATSLGKNKEWNKSDLFVLALLISAWILIALPEIIFVKDIYIATHHRANTMFKLTYQAFVMSYLAGGYISLKMIESARGITSKVLSSLLLSVVIGAVLWYPNFAVNSYYGGLKIYRGLSGEEWLNTRYPGIYNAILWLRKNAQGQPVILEAPGDSYTDYNVISSYTGLPTVSGWFVHEWLWRGSSEIPSKRAEDVRQIYVSEDMELTSEIVEKYKIKYIIVGPFEMEKYPDINLIKISGLGKAVYQSQDTVIYQLP